MHLPKTITLDDCRPYIAEVINAENFIPVTNVLPIDNASADTLAFITSKAKNKEDLLRSSKAITIITDITTNLPTDKCCLISDNPKLAFARIINSVFESVLTDGRIHPTAIIHPEAKVNESAIVGPYCVIGNASIGPGTRLYPNVVVYDNVIIGSNCIIDSGAVIGAAGFGFVRDDNGVPVPFPQLGGVRIGDNVEIGANVCIDRGALKDTIIHDNVKIDNFSQIAHNDEIGKNTLIIGTAIAGSVSIGENCHIAGLWMMNQKHVGDNVTLGGGAIALSSLHSNKTYMGYPAIPIERYQKIHYQLKKLSK